MRAKEKWHLQRDLDTVQDILAQIRKAIQSAHELTNLAEWLQEAFSKIADEEDSENIVRLQKIAEELGTRAHSVPIILWSFARASIDIPGALVASINALEEK